jgi:gluconate 2-dehydrogenase subunit 3-like protein
MATGFDIPELSTDQRRALVCVLDALIPPSADGRLPGAGAAGVASHVEGVLRTLPDLHAMVVEGLRDLDAQARAQHERAFVELGEAERTALVGMQGFSYALVPHAYIGYYQVDSVLEAIGIEARAPHPQGYAVPENDLTLLEPVKARGARWRSY